MFVLATIFLAFVLLRPIRDGLERGIAFAWISALYSLDVAPAVSVILFLLLALLVVAKIMRHVDFRKVF